VSHLATDTPDRPGTTRLKQLATGSIRQLTLVGLGLYAVTRVSFVLHYSRFGLRPEDVGLDYSQTLVHSLYYVVYVATVLLVFAPLFAALLALSVFWVFLIPGVRRWLRRVRPWRPNGRGLAVVGWAYLALLVAAVVVVLPVIAWQSAGATLDGRDFFARTPWTDVLGSGFTPDRVRVYSAGSAVPMLDDGSCLFVLGSADGVSALYDSRHHRVVRVPRGEIVLVGERSGDPRCTP
jgi:hypothetical protein